MALLWMDGFDSYTDAADLNMEYGYVNVDAFSTSGGRFGGGGIHLNGYQSGIGVGLGSTQTDIWLGFAWYPIQQSSAGVLALSGSEGSELQINFDSNTGDWQYFVNTGNLELANHMVSMNAWHWLEIHVTFGYTTGAIEIWVDDTQICSVTNINTNEQHSQSTTGYTAVNVGAQGSMEMWIDDLYILSTSGGGNTTRLGDSKITTLVPASDAGPNNGTMTGGSGSNHYSCVDEAQSDYATSYLTITNTSGQEELFGVSTISDTPPNVWALRVLNVSEKTDAGAAQLENIVVSNGTTGTGTAKTPSTNWGHLFDIFETDPHTTAQWTYANVNAIDVGVKVP